MFRESVDLMRVKYNFHLCVLNYTNNVRNGDLFQDSGLMLEFCECVGMTIVKKNYNLCLLNHINNSLHSQLTRIQG